MPAVPEFLDALRGIGGFEVFGEVHAKKLGTANGNVAVTRKVAEDLQGKQEGGKKSGGAVCSGCVFIHTVDKHANRIGDGDLFEKAKQHIAESA